MEPYIFNDDFSQKLVDGLRQGYLDYLEERFEKKREMIVSSGYSWTRANHIDDQIKRQFDGDDTVDPKVFQTSSWKFVCFKIREGGHYIWLVQKPQRTIDGGYLGGKENGKRNVISQWGIEFNKDFKDLFTNKKEAEQLSILDMPEEDEQALNEVRQESSSDDVPEALYLLTYRVNDSKDISDVGLNLFFGSKVLEIKDLKALNAASPVRMPSEILEGLDSSDLINPNTENEEQVEFYKEAKKQTKKKTDTDTNNQK